MTISTQKLEERAKELLKWKITREGKAPNPFTETGKIAEELQFLIDQEYVIEMGGTPKSLRYEVTAKGREYVSRG